MYLHAYIIKKGLEEGQEFPSLSHENVCENIILGNSEINTMDLLTKVVQIVITIPMDRIKNISWVELKTEFNCPGL